MEINPRGSWEPVTIWKLNEEFMLRHGTAFTDPSMRLQELIINVRENEEYTRKIQAFLKECACGSVLLIKQPHITQLMGFWAEAARRNELSLKVVIAIRHPREVFGSIAALGAAKKTSLELTNAFWLKLNLLAERDSRNFPRVFVEYSNLLEDWRVEVARVSKALSIELKPDETAIDNFLTRDLHRQRFSGPVTETFGYSWVTRVYANLSAAAQDEPLDLPTMDEIYHAYRANERAFRIAWDEFCDRYSLIDPQHVREMLDSAPVFRSGRDF
jgi:hypothetical protein